ncbi:MAG: hypothetical protein ABI581_13540 [Sediminibacterium sp.]
MSILSTDFLQLIVVSLVISMPLAWIATSAITLGHIAGKGHGNF